MESLDEIHQNLCTYLIDSVFNVTYLFNRLVASLYNDLDVSSHSLCAREEIFDISIKLKSCNYYLERVNDGFILNTDNYVKSLDQRSLDIGALNDVFKGLHNDPEYDFEIVSANNICLMLRSMSIDGLKWTFTNDANLVHFYCKISEYKNIKELCLQYDAILLLFISLSDFFGFCSKEAPVFSNHLSPNCFIKLLHKLFAVVYLPIYNNFTDCDTNTKLYHDLCSEYYKLNKLPPKRSILSCRVLFRSYLILLRRGLFDITPLPTLLRTNKLIVKDPGIIDEIYEILELIMDNPKFDIIDFKKHTLSLEEVISRCNNPSHLRCYIKLSIVLYKGTVKMYEYLEKLIDYILMKNELLYTKAFLLNFNYYLNSIPLACSATMLPLMELIFKCIDSLNIECINIALSCLNDIFNRLPNDVVYYLNDIMYYLTILRLLKFQNSDEMLRIVNELHNLEVFNDVTFRFTSSSKLGPIDFNEDTVSKIYRGMASICCKNNFTTLNSSINDNLLRYLHAVNANTTTINFINDFNSSMMQNINQKNIDRSYNL